MVVLGTATPLAVVDQRSQFTAVAFGWQRVQLVPTWGFREDVERLVAGSTAALPVSAEWTVSNGAECLTLAVPRLSTNELIRRVVGHSAAAGAGDPVVSLAGSAEEVFAAQGVLAELSPPACPEGKMFSSISQTTVAGVQRTTITGADPSPVAGSVETLLAGSLVASMPGSVIESVACDLGFRVSAEISKGLHGNFSTMRWRISSPHQCGLGVVEELVERFAADVPLGVSWDLFAAKRFVLDSLRGAWRSPLELARAMAHFEVLGWGGRLVREPAAALAGVSEEGVHAAVHALLQPMRDVLGRS